MRRASDDTPRGAGWPRWPVLVLAAFAVAMLGSVAGATTTTSASSAHRYDEPANARDDARLSASSVDSLPAVRARLARSVSPDSQAGWASTTPAGVDIATEAGESGTELARRLGTEGEALAGIDPAAKVRIPSLTNSASYRIPDALTETTLTEVKNVARQGFTPQLQDFSYYASQTGRRFDLIVRENTVLTRELEDIVNMTGSPINLIRGLPAK